MTIWMYRRLTLTYECNASFNPAASIAMHPILPVKSLFAEVLLIVAYLEKVKIKWKVSGIYIQDTIKHEKPKSIISTSYGSWYIANHNMNINTNMVWTTVNSLIDKEDRYDLAVLRLFEVNDIMSAMGRMPRYVRFVPSITVWKLKQTI